MAQKKAQYESSAASIFDFIFASNKPNAPQKPPRNVPGVSGDELAYALGEIASAPAMYVSEQALNVVNEPLDNVEVAKVSEAKLDDAGNKLKVGISTASFADFLTNPEGFLDKGFAKTEGGKKAARQLAYMRGFGGILDLGIGAVLARSAGAPVGASLAMAQVLGSEVSGIDARNMRAEESATRASALEAAQAHGLNFNEANTLAQVFNSAMDSNRISLANESIGSLNPGDRARLQSLVTQQMTKHGITLSSTAFDDLLQKYADRAKKYKQDKGYDWNLGTLDKNTARRDYFRVNGLNINNPADWSKSQNPGDKERALKYEELQAEIALLPSTDPRRLRLQNDLTRLEIWQASNGDKWKWSRFMGEAHLNIQAFNSMVLQGGAIPGLINGDFFDIRKNNMAPSTERVFTVVGALNGGRKDFATKIMLPRDDMNRIYTNLTHLYYLTPASIGKTLFINGEGFAYLEALKQRKIQSMIKGSDALFLFLQANAPSIPALNALIPASLLNDQKAMLEFLSKEENYGKLINILGLNRESITDPDLLRLFNKIETLHFKLQNSSTFKYLAWLESVRAKFAKYNPINLLKKGFGSMFLKIFGEKGKQFLIDGSISLRKIARGLAKKAVMALAKVFGFAFGGPLGTVLVALASEVIYFIGEKVLKVGIKIAAAFIWGLILIFAVVIFGFFTGRSQRAGLYVGGNMPPTHQIVCDSGVEEALNNPDDEELASRRGGEPFGGGEPPPKIAGAICPLQPSSVKCTQRPFGGFSHSSKNAIDVVGPANTYWYAPSDGIVTKSIRVYYNSRLPWQKCGGIVHFKSDTHGVTYVLVHVVSYVSQNQRVTQGTPIAKMSARGDSNINFTSASGTCATGPHLHLEIWGNNTLADRYYRETLCCDVSACPGSNSPVGVPGGCGAGGETEEDCDDFKTFSGVEFKELGDKILGTSLNKPHITNNPAADNRIRYLAEERGYKPRKDAGSFNSSASNAYDEMAKDAKEENLVLHMDSSWHYRTVDRQRYLFTTDLNKNEGCTSNNYANVINGNCDSEIDRILSTRSIPGYSKHHTGFAIDLACGTGGSLTGFSSTSCFTWMSKNNYCNAKKHGFIPSYPSGAGNQGPDPEPWEYIYVGVENLKK